MKIKWILIFLAFANIVMAQMPTPAALLEKSIQYHDPKGNWGKTPLELKLEETRLNGITRETLVNINLPDDYFSMNQTRGADQIIRTMQNGTCQHLLNGSTDISEEDAKKLGLNCDRTTTMRNYYTYLWGLPMKLKDPGTILGDRVEMVEFNGVSAYRLRVSYDPNVGSDVWYFYFNPKTFALIGYRFYHDEAKGDGEYITLKDEMKIGGMQLPKARTWYTNQEDKLLGTDILVEKGK